MNILLVYPEFPETFWSLRHALKFISKKAILPPLGLLTVAAMLPEDWNLKLVDMTVTKLTDRDIQWADYVFISAMYLQKEFAKKIVAKCKSLDTKIVAGGPLFTRDYKCFPEVDHLVLNEAEITLPPFLEDLKNGCPKHLYASDQWADIEKTPIPRWDLVNMKTYVSMPIQYSRGCPFRCDFCDVTLLFGNKIRTKTTDQMLAELDSLYAHRWRSEVFIVDDNFIGNKKKLKTRVLPAMARWMKKRNYIFPLNTQTSINLADDEELMQSMVKAGFDTVFIGVETPNADSLDECNKSQNTNRDLMASIKKIQQYGLHIQGGFILGFDSDKTSIFDQLIAFIQQSGIVTAMVGLLHAPQGSRLYDRLLKENRLLGVSSGNNTDLSLNFIPKINSEELIKGYKKVVQTIYSSEYYYKRILTFLKNYKTIQKRTSLPGLYEMKILLKSAWVLGLKRKGRSYYWRIILWTLFRRPQHLKLAVTFMIYGFHFHKLFAENANPVI